MLRIRIVSIAAAVTAVATIAAADGTVAQTVSAAPSGQPLPLVQSTTTTTTVRTYSDGGPKVRVRKTASKRHHDTAAAKTSDPDQAQNTSSADAWLAASAPPAKSATSPSDGAPAAQPGNAPPDVPSNNAQSAQPGNAQTGADGSLPAAVVVAGQTVQIAKADEVNAIDLAADVAPPTESTELPGDRVDTAVRAKQALQAAFAAQPQHDANQVANDRQDIAQTLSRAASQGTNQDTSQDASQDRIADQGPSMIGSATWIAQILAALGGALAAGVLAWFLIGAGPVRSYG
jgi:hypothetical protein